MKEVSTLAHPTIQEPANYQASTILSPAWWCLVKGNVAVLSLLYLNDPRVSSKAKGAGTERRSGSRNLGCMPELEITTHANEGERR